MFNGLKRAHDTITHVAAQFGGIALGAIVVGYVYEVVSRYFFAAPTSWASDLSAYMLCVSTFLMIPNLARTHGHIAIEFVQEALPHHVRHMLRRVVFLLASLVTGTGAWISLMENIRQFDRNLETLAANPIPKWWISVFITYGFAGVSIYFLRHFFDYSPAADSVSATED